MSVLQRAILLPAICFGTSLIAQPGSDPRDPDDGYEIKLTLKPLKNTSVYLAHYFGTETPIFDTAFLDENSSGVFKGNKKLDGGIYLVLYAGQPGYLDMLIDQQQHFSVETDISNPDIIMVKFKNSPDNLLLNKYQQFMGLKQQEIMAAREKLYNAINPRDSIDMVHQLSGIDKLIQDYRDSIISRNPGSLLATLFKVLRHPVVPERLRNPLNKTDSAEARYFVRKHYWDNVNFSDSRLTYTPFFNDKVDRYFAEVADLQTDSVSRDLDWIMGFASPSEKMTHFLLNKFIQASLYHYYKWDDPVFIHIFEKWIATKTYDWLTVADQQKISEKAYYLMGKMIGAPSPDIRLTDQKDKKVNLSGLDAKYILLCFWDPTCGHCKEMLPSLDSMYRSKLKKAGFKIFAVAMETDGTKDDWHNFINGKNIQDWMHVYNSIDDDKERALAGKKGYSQLFDVWYYPSFFLLDKNKNFIAKKLPWPKMEELLNSMLKKN